MANIRTILKQAAHDLHISGSPSSRLDAEIILARLLKIDRLKLLTHQERDLSKTELSAFEELMERRKRGEPVAYITGEKEFWSLRFEVDRNVLIPRPETECLVEEILRFYRPGGEGLRIIDIGTGSGAIAVALSGELLGASIVASDISEEALSVARRNALANGAALRIAFFHGDLFAAAPGNFDIICSNPPYIPEREYAILPAGIRDFEPRGALIAGPDGLDFHRRIIAEGGGRLKPGGRIFLEIGSEQMGMVEALFREVGVYHDISCRRDYGGAARVISARKRVR